MKTGAFAALSEALASVSQTPSVPNKESHEEDKNEEQVEDNMPRVNQIFANASDHLEEIEKLKKKAELGKKSSYKKNKKPDRTGGYSDKMKAKDKAAKNALKGSTKNKKPQRK